MTRESRVHAESAGCTRDGRSNVAGLHNGRVPNFTVVLRGYDRAEVDAFVRRVNAAVESDNHEVRAGASQQLRQCTFSVRLRGYDRLQVDDYLHPVAATLA